MSKSKDWWDYSDCSEMPTEEGDPVDATGADLEAAPDKEALQVCVRIRPLVRDDRDKDEILAWEWDEQSIHQCQFPLSMQQRGIRQTVNQMSQNQGSKSASIGWDDKRKDFDMDMLSRPFDPLLDEALAAPYNFDHLFNPDATNDDIYQSVIKDIVNKSLLGYHGSVFTYGQTSSGKTFTMTGTRENPGIIPESIIDVFQQIANDTERTYVVKLNYLEVYMEGVHDLLRTVVQPETEVRVLYDPKSNRVVLSGLRECIVTSPIDVLQLMKKGESMRHIGATNMNDTSSRAHTLFRLIIQSKANSGGPMRESTLSLVDLAGSENQKMTGSTGERQLEGKSINQSLLALSTIIQRLSETNKSHLPFRDSKLTRILQEALCGNAVIAIICTISPALRCADETHNTLKFATRAKKITLAHAEINEIGDERDEIIKQLKKTIETLNKKIEDLSKQVSEGGYSGGDNLRGRSTSISNHDVRRRY